MNGIITSYTVVISGGQPVSFDGVPAGQAQQGEDPFGLAGTVSGTTTASLQAAGDGFVMTITTTYTTSDPIPAGAESCCNQQVAWTLIASTTAGTEIAGDAVKDNTQFDGTQETRTGTFTMKRQ